MQAEVSLDRCQVVYPDQDIIDFSPVDFKSAIHSLGKPKVFRPQQGHLRQPATVRDCSFLDQGVAVIDAGCVAEADHGVTIGLLGPAHFSLCFKDRCQVGPGKSVIRSGGGPSNPTIRLQRSCQKLLGLFVVALGVEQHTQAVGKLQGGWMIFAVNPARQANGVLQEGFSFVESILCHTVSSQGSDRKPGFRHCLHPETRKRPSSVWRK